ncbi:hypothetical protein CEUSTIGMA_g2594.t1 [Chlamydomonas eustigma]|uniref:Uncharacterized protein n=1 Tax=Chlamydomonas eustigma TaxID=1157962 RepID=A0A250WX95_9CHLO|nr:hypothetical protein CEUSTIGMA_g2594.t1 [Chlamydomonas eustigma]|eukprot:GAX75150.1 hypothetical protein CEUSTIGMA_g2594.t1 [Chlamydomonas eustigma]
MDVVMRRCFEGRVCSSSMRGFVKSSIHVEACSTSRNRKMMLAMGRLDYLDFDWKDDNKADDLADIKNKYDDYLRQDKASVAAGGQFTWSRRRPIRDAYDLYDEFEDDYDDIPEQPKVQEPRFLNGKQILTNTEINKAPGSLCKLLWLA